MPIIKRVEKAKKANLSVRIEEGTAANLKLYAEYTNVPSSEIVETAIRHVINSDAEFLQTLCKKSSGKTLPEAKLQPKSTAA